MSRMLITGSADGLGREAAGQPCKAAATSIPFHHRKLRETHPAVTDPAVQDGLLAACDELTGQAITDTTGTTHAVRSR
jgi:NAD(P)-dependent dehydrogenase (short-subunit alcohol dehydrogenase family)